MTAPGRVSASCQSLRGAHSGPSFWEGAHLGVRSGARNETRRTKCWLLFCRDTVMTSPPDGWTGGLAPSLCRFVRRIGRPPCVAVALSGMPCARGCVLCRRQATTVGRQASEHPRRTLPANFPSSQGHVVLWLSTEIEGLDRMWRWNVEHNRLACLEGPRSRSVCSPTCSKETVTDATVYKC